MKVTRFHHVSVNGADAPLEDMVAFYRDVLGLGDVDRPDIPGIPGHWHAVGDQQLHLVGAPAAGDGIDPTGNHFCVTVDDLDAAIAQLEQLGHPLRAWPAGRGHGADLDRRSGRQHDRAPAGDRRLRRPAPPQLVSLTKCVRGRGCRVPSTVRSTTSS